MNERDGKLLYHLTSLTNLASIASNGLRSRRDCRDLEIGFDDIADPAILANREAFSLDAMVPFHFFAKNPFDCAVKRRNPDNRLMLLAVTRDYAQKAGWRIIPAHPLAGGVDVNPVLWDIGIDQINWDLIAKREYSDHACRQACMAEALSPQAVPLSACSSIYVASEDDKATATRLAGHIVQHINVNARMFPR